MQMRVLSSAALALSLLSGAALAQSTGNPNAMSQPQYGTQGATISGSNPTNARGNYPGFAGAPITSNVPGSGSVTGSGPSQGPTTPFDYGGNASMRNAGEGVGSSTSYDSRPSR